MEFKALDGAMAEWMGRISTQVPAGESGVLHGIRLFPLFL